MWEKILEWSELAKPIVVFLVGLATLKYLFLDKK